MKTNQIVIHRFIIVILLIVIGVGFPLLMGKSEDAIAMRDVNTRGYYWSGYLIGYYVGNLYAETYYNQYKEFPTNDEAWQAKYGWCSEHVRADVYAALEKVKSWSN